MQAGSVTQLQLTHRLFHANFIRRSHPRFNGVDVNILCTIAQKYALFMKIEFCELGTASENFKKFHLKTVTVIEQCSKT